MPVTKKIIFPLLLAATLLVKPVHAQQQDSSQITHLIHAFVLDEFMDTIPVKMDTALDNFYIYNPATDSLNLMSLWLGNIAQPATPAWQLPLNPRGYFEKAYNTYLQQYGTPEYYDTHSFFTNLYYFTNGSKANNLQSINFLHTQNINRHWNFATQYNLFASNGIYAAQKSKFSSFVFTTYYQHKHRYAIALSAINRQFKNFYNGGLKSFDYFHTNFATVNFPVNLTSARIKNRFFEFHVKQKIKLVHKIYLQVNSSYLLQKYYHTDKPNGFYHLYTDSTETNDSALSYTLSNSAMLAIKIGKLSFLAGYTHKLYNYNINGTRLYPYDGTAQTIVKINGKHGDKLQASATYHLSGYYGGGYEMNAQWYKHLSSQIQLNTTLNHFVLSPSPYYNIMNFNNIKYSQTLAPVQATITNASLSFGKFTFIAHASWSYNTILFDTLGTPYNLKNNLFHTFAAIKFSTGTKHFATDATILYQTINRAAVSLPPTNISASLFYKGWLVKNVLRLQTGIRAYYFSAFKPAWFYPATSQLVYSYAPAAKTSYPLTDLFFNFKLKRARLFFVISHVNYQLWPDTVTFYNVYPYPWPVRTFRFGISWNFYDRK